MHEKLIENTDTLYDAVCDLLHEGVRMRAHPFHLMTLATIGLDNLPKSRTVVLRRFDPFHRQLYFYSDVRSHKIDEIKKSSAIVLLFYSMQHKLQLRLTAKATIHHRDELCKGRWEQTQTMSKMCYLSDEPSGQFPFEEMPMDKPVMLTREQDALGFDRFVVVACDFHEMEALELGERQHKRARLRWDKKNNLMIDTFPA